MKLPEQKYVDAAENFDWMQVQLNGGPPCFHYDDHRQRFCGRAHRWAGHLSMHEFVSLPMLIQLTAQEDQPSGLPCSAWDSRCMQYEGLLRRASFLMQTASASDPEMRKFIDEIERLVGSPSAKETK
jgi:hypothetical protein